MARFLVHIGYPKAGSTTLQRGLFGGGHPELIPLGEPGPASGAYPKPGGGLFCDPGGEGYLPFAFDEARAKARLAELAPGDGVYVLSNEDWTGHPFSGGQAAKEIAERIEAVMPEARILIVIREQVGMALSAYAHALTKTHGAMSLEDFLRPKMTSQIPGFDLTYLLYGRLVAHYRKLFGENRVLVLPLEDMAKDRAAFEARLCAFAGVDPPPDRPAEARENTRDYRDYAALRRAPRLNLLGRSTPSNGFAGLKAQKLRTGLVKAVRLTISDEAARRRREADEAIIREWATEAVAEDNARLAAMTGLDLSAHGYLLPKAAVS